MRLWLNIGGILALLVVNIRLITTEYVSEVGENAVKLYEDRLRDVIYISSERENNFRAFGLDDRLVDKAMKKAKRYGSKKRSKQIEGIFKSNEDADGMLAIFCGQKDDIRPRYHGLRYLIEEDTKGRRLLDIKKATSALEPQSWAEAIDIVGLWTQLELVAEPEQNATVMYAAALILGAEGELIDRQAPWGKGTDWEWDAVQRDYKGIGLDVADYLALMHVFTEVAQDPARSICKTE